MTPEQLQDAIKDWLEELLRNYTLPTRSGERRPIRIFKQDLPIPSENDEDVDTDDVMAPYGIVRISTGTFGDWTDSLHVSVILILCVVDEAKERQGCRDLLSVITKIYRNIAANPHIGNFTCETPIEWALQDEVETYPYYYGAMQLTFSLPGVRLEDPLA